MQTLIAAGLTGPGGSQLSSTKWPQDEHVAAMKALVGAGIVGAGDITTTSPFPAALQQQFLTAEEGAKARQNRNVQTACDKNPSGLECSEYPIDTFQPEFARVLFGSKVKVSRSRACLAVAQTILSP